MIKLLRVDDNLLHGQVAFSWVRNLRIHTIIVADDKVANDQFMKMSLGLAKPVGVNLIIDSVDNAIEILRTDDKLNILVIVGNIRNAEKMVSALKLNKVNIGLVRNRNECVLHYGSIQLDNEDVELVKDMLKKDVYVEYRLRYDDEEIPLEDIFKENNI